jgi:hypothetical protein
LFDIFIIKNEFIKIYKSLVKFFAVTERQLLQVAPQTRVRQFKAPNRPTAK